ncbi:MAG TPA: phosphoenolpyruvate carboxylase, partial [Chitinophagaceae bacterium]|nr:phosphoenolpyruvate carboxylase [Chitinophagaceae bacterium]
ERFRNFVGVKFQLYNSLFTSLPFHRIEKTGILLSLFLSVCEDGFKKKQSPKQIIEDFFNKHTSSLKEEDKLDLLFRFVQYAERQVVLFDALEDAAFREVNDMNGVGTLKHLESEVVQEKLEDKLTQKLKDFNVLLVLTAHPTQFYPGPVLGIINDLSKALAENNASQVNVLLQQLGKTPFFKHQKPTPYDEAVSLIWYLENVFYAAAGRIASFFKNHFSDSLPNGHSVISMGFWPGGDRDGNPFVKAETTLQVAEALRGAIIKCYYLEIRRLKRRLTFQGVDVLLADLEKKLYNNLFVPGQITDITQAEILKTLNEIRDILIYKHNSLFLHLVNNLKNKVEIFGLHFASLDVRQESSVHATVIESFAGKTKEIPGNYSSLSEDEKIKILSNLQPIDPSLVTGDEIQKDTIESVQVIKQIQKYNGVQGCDRYIISQCNSALNAMEVYGLFLLGGWKKEELNIDIVPLFETIDDLKGAASIMKKLYTNEEYKQHLKRRNNSQVIMVGFSDGTKDGGYLMANWSIYKAKEELTTISKECGIDVVFFDGRGGPPARGGGKTHKFYASLGKNISNKEIQLTVQGQTVSSNFGTIDSAQYNMEQLIHAGISNGILANKETVSEEDRESGENIVQQLADISFDSYNRLKNHPDFTDYLVHASPLRFYSDTNIGSRPAKRGASAKFSLKSLRAIPFVGAWSQLKQNVTGYFGVGTALQKLEQEGKLPDIKKLYNESLYFKTLLDNCEMAMIKSFFPLTAHLADHPKFGEIWQIIFKEYELTKQYVLRLSGKTELMDDYPIEQLSIQMRERIVLPLLTIQQYSMIRVREMEEAIINAPVKGTYEKLVMRCSFGIINAGRNSA